MLRLALSFFSWFAAFIRSRHDLGLEHADLLIISEAQESTQPPKETCDEFEHEGNLHGPLLISKVPPNPLISQGDRFLATQRSS
jgi:hypothetical protein